MNEKEFKNCTSSAQKKIIENLKSALENENLPEDKKNYFSKSLKNYSQWKNEQRKMYIKKWNFINYENAKFNKIEKFRINTIDTQKEIILTIEKKENLFSLTATMKNENLELKYSFINFEAILDIVEFLEEAWD